MFFQSESDADFNAQFCSNRLQISTLIASIHQKLLPNLKLESVDPNNPVVVHYLPQPWQLLGTGNYAGVFYHPDYLEVVVKVYAPGRLGWAEEVEVYRRLGSHPAFSECFYAEPSWLILKRLNGVTLYDCLYLGLKIPPQVIEDIDLALQYTRQRDLYPHDVHGRNVMMYEGRGLVVDISDFLNQQPCRAWNDVKKAYYLVYLPFLSWLPLRIPYFVLNLVRKCYQLFRRLMPRSVKSVS